VSSEGKVLETRARSAGVCLLPHQRPEKAPDTPQYVTIDFERGDATALTAKSFRPPLLTKLNELGRIHGIGRLDLVENRFVGMKSRGMYETPAGDPARRPSRIESLTLDRGAAHLKDELMHATPR